MAISITSEEVQQERAFDRFLPPEPTLTDLESAPIVEALAFAGTERGMLLKVIYRAGGTRNLFINPTIAVILVEGIAQAGKVHDWWPDLADASVPLAADLTRADLTGAEHVRSVRTANTPDGMLAYFGSEQGRTKFFLRPNYAAAIAYSIDDIAKKARWWDGFGAVVQYQPN